MEEVGRQTNKSRGARKQEWRNVLKFRTCARVLVCGGAGPGPSRRMSAPNWEPPNPTTAIPTVRNQPSSRPSRIRIIIYFFVRPNGSDRSTKKKFYLPISPPQKQKKHKYHPPPHSKNKKTFHQNSKYDFGDKIQAIEFRFRFKFFGLKL